MVVIIVPSLKSGGTEWQTLFLLQELTKTHRICLWVYDRSSAQTTLAARFHAIQGLTFEFGAGLSSVLRLWRRRPKLILSYAINYYLPEILLKVLCGATLITERRNLYHWLSSQRRRITQERMRNALTAQVICNSQTVATRVAAMEPEVARKIVVIHNSVSPLELASRQPRAIVSVANIKRGKGLEIVLRAMADLRARYSRHAWLQFAIYGRLDEPQVFAGADPQLLDEIYKGEQNREVIFESALCLFHLSEAEGFPNSVLEAASAGVVPILSDIPIHRELFEDCALFVDGQQSATIAAVKIVELAEHEPEQLDQMAEKCRHIAQRFTAERRAAQYERILRAHRV